MKIAQTARNIAARISSAFAPRNRVEARFDAAQTTSNNVQHWADADALSANVATSAPVRRTLRMRARHEVANNSYAYGIVQTLANDTIGTGPRLQVQTANTDLNTKIEREFYRWSNAIGLAAKLRLMRICRSQDGEAFGVLVNNPKIKTPVQLDVKLIEADQVASSWTATIFTPNAVDGMKFDDLGNVIEWHVLKHHPGDYWGMGIATGYDTISPDFMLHYFRATRPGQMRGIPEITPALGLFAQLRQYSQSVLDTARAASNVAGIVHTDLAQVVEDEGATVSKDTVLNVQRNAWVTLPAGWGITQMQAAQPVDAYKDFKNEIIGEIARCMNMPFNVAAGNSSTYNYASGRLDHQTYYKSLKVERECMIDDILDRVFSAWLKEASYIPGYISGIDAGAVDVAHQWFWAGTQHVDPAKEATAQSTRLASRTTTYAQEYARDGLDWETQFNQIAKEQARAKLLGIELPVANPGMNPLAISQSKTPAENAEIEEPLNDDHE
jgi:lambda family phage portal protein